jgi:hypothetical protein
VTGGTGRVNDGSISFISAGQRAADEKDSARIGVIDDETSITDALRKRDGAIGINYKPLTEDALE